MARASKKTPDEKLRIVLSVLRGEATATEAARRAGVSEQAMSNWKRQFIEAGRQGVAAPVGRSRPLLQKPAALTAPERVQGLRHS